MSEYAHWRSGGKSWKNAAEAVGLDPATVAICGSTGTAARVTGDITCPDCLELRESANDHPERIARAAVLVSIGKVGTIREALAVVDSEPEPEPEPAAGESGPESSPGTVLGMPAEVGTMLLGGLPYMLTDRYLGWRHDGARRLAPPPLPAVKKIGEAINSGLAMSPELERLINGPVGGLIVAGFIFMMSVQVVDVERDGETTNRPTIKDDELAQAWGQTVAGILGAGG